MTGVVVSASSYRTHFSMYMHAAQLTAKVAPDRQRSNANIFLCVMILKSFLLAMMGIGIYKIEYIYIF